MFRADRQQTHAPTSFPAAMSSSSLSSSFSSSTSSSMLHHAVSPDNSGHSDILTSDHSASPLPTPTKTHFPSVAVSPAPRSSSLGAMGQTYSRSEPAVPTVSSALSTPASLSKGFNLKNAFGARRKQSEDAHPIPLSLSRTRSKGKGKGRQTDDASVTSYETELSPGRRPLRAKQLTLQLASAFGKQSSTTVSAPTSPGLPPPPPPPKPTGLAKKTHVPPSTPAADNRRSVMVPSPGITAALQYMQNGEPSSETEMRMPQQSEADKKDQEKAETKEVWRQSDSNMSFNTIRPGAAAAGNRTSRPVSMAESLRSTHTIVPVNKRLSALVTDADFVMAEEGGQEIVISSVSMSGKASPSGSVKSRNRRSASLILTSPFPRARTQSPASASAADEGPKPKPRLPVQSPQVSPSSSTRETPTLTRTAANGYIAPMTSGAAVQSAGNNIRGRLAAWSATGNNTSSPSQQERHLPDIPPQHRRMRPNEQASASNMRQTAVSITSSFSSGLAKRAVEKMGRAWGGRHPGSGSGHSSSSSTYTAPSLSSDPSAEDLGRSNAVQSPPKHFATGIGIGKQRRTPNAPSGAWSVASSTTSSSLSDSDAYLMPAGPSLGKRMRGPTRSTGGGAVFGRDLRSCVAETALPVTPFTQTGTFTGRPPHSRTASGSKAQKEQDNKGLEARRVPALVVRCAQHILAWGVQEEGLFRLTGRPSHMSKLRSEFDTGADYDLSECNLGDLDPHAVSSIFKAYLRELPEPILTHALMPYFEAVLSAESHSRESQETPHALRGVRGPALPANPRAAGSMRKPPSLSTLAMPNFSGMRAPSESLVNALRSLVAGLPQENRDLLHTVTDLIKATAKRSRETKMPLSNLLLVFCPSLNMNPPLLRVLCEAEGIWNIPLNPLGQPGVVDIRREIVTMDIGPDTSCQPESPTTDTEEVLESMTNEAVTSPGSHHSPSQEILPDVPEAAVAQSDVDSVAPQQPPERNGSPAHGSRPLGARRGPVATVYLDSDNADDLVSQSFTASHAAEVTPSATFSESVSLKDDTSLNRSSSASPAPPNPYSPPSLSSSTDSLTSSETPSSSHLPLPENDFDKSEVSSRPRTLTIVEPADLPLLPTPQRSTTGPAVGGDLRFPSTGSLPTSPLNRRPSKPKLSLNGSIPPSQGPASASSLRTRRIKKPSLHLLFTRRSSASLHAASINPASISTPTPFMQPPHSASPLSSASTPMSAQQSMYTAQTSSPPVLDMAIETSSLQLGISIDNDIRQTISIKPSSSHSNHTATDSKNDEPPLLLSTVTLTPNETPIANLYSTPSSSVVSFDVDENAPPLRARPRPPQVPPTSSNASFNHLSMALPDEEAAEDSWAESVLAAADMDGSWSAKNVMKFFGGGS